MTPPRKPPLSAGVLARYARAYATELGVAEGRVRAWIAYMVLAGLLEQVAGGGGARFTVKGGVALELRLLQHRRHRARATRDIDLVLHDPDADLARALERAATAAEYQGFSFRRRREPLDLDNGTVNMELAVTYRGGSWTTVSVDIARAEPGEAEVEFVPAIDLEPAMGIVGPVLLPCLPVRLHVAQKLHGMTLPPRPGKRNERFRDLVDLLLLEELVTTDVALREACEQVFLARGTHNWPPPLGIPPHWDEPFAKVAAELDLPVTDAAAAMERVRAWVERIRAS